MKSTPKRAAELRELLTSLAGDENALVRTAIRLSLDELDRADLASDPAPHYTQVTRLIDAVLNPTDEDGAR